MLRRYHIILVFAITFLNNGGSALQAQDSLPESKHAAIVFPYPMYREKWRTSIGFSLLTTPEDITEEVHIRVPAIDFRVLRRLSNHLIAAGRINTQILQSQLLLGLYWTQPLSNKLFFSAGNNIGYWFGFLTVEGFNSRARGWLTYPNISLGYRTKRDLLITLQAQVSVNVAYKAFNGKEELSSGRVFYNGETFTIAIEQPFYHHKHVTLALSAINNYFFWQTWSLFYRVDRKIFYPQITVGFIL